MVLGEALSTAEGQRELVRDYLTRIGGVTINQPLCKGEYKLMATMPGQGDWTRLFLIEEADIDNLDTEDTQMQFVSIPDSSAIFFKIVGDKARAILVCLERVGWKVEDLQKGNVYGFEEIPVAIDRARRVLKSLKDTDARENAVEFPIDTPDIRGPIKATVEPEVDFDEK